METISRRLFLIIILLIALIGTVGIIYYSASSFLGKKPQNPESAINERPKPTRAIEGSGNRRIKAPMAVISDNGSLHVADSGNGRVLVFSQTGAFKREIKPPGDGYIYPVGLALDQKKRLYLSSLGAEPRITAFTFGGDQLYKFPTGASQEASLYAIPGKPIALFAGDDRLYVTDVLDQDVKVYDYKGKLDLRFGRPGNAKGEFLYPNGITADSGGTIYVSDSNNARVQVFNARGEFLYAFNGPKSDPLALPRGLALDKNGRLHVVDTMKHKVLVFTKKGRFLFAYGSFGKGRANLAYPNGISIDKATGAIYIADKLNNRISVWE